MEQQLENTFIYSVLISRISFSYGYEKGCKKHSPSLLRSPCSYLVIFLLYHHPRFVLNILKIRKLFKHWKSSEGENKRKFAKSGHLSCFFPVNHLFLSCPFSVKKTPNQTEISMAPFVVWPQNSPQTEANWSSKEERGRKCTQEQKDMLTFGFILLKYTITQNTHHLSHWQLKLGPLLEKKLMKCRWQLVYWVGCFMNCNYGGYEMDHLIHLE